MNIWTNLLLNRGHVVDPRLVAELSEPPVTDRHSQERRDALKPASPPPKQAPAARTFTPRIAWVSFR